MINYSLTKLKPVIRDYGCRNRLPHDFKPKSENNRVKVEICHICNKKVSFKKHYKGRTDNRAYLDSHARNFCQPYGRTKRLYMKINHPDKTIITI